MLRGRPSRGGCGLDFRLLQCQLTVDLELHLLADEETAPTERNVPGEAPVRPVHRSGQGAADLRVAEGIDDRAGVLVVEGQLAGDLFDLQVACDLEVVALGCDRLQRENNLGVLLGVEEVGALEMTIALLRVRRDARGLDGHRATAGGRVVRIVQLQGSGYLAEAATDGGDPEVLRAEGNGGVMRVKTPRHGVYSLNAGSAPGGSGGVFTVR